MKLLGVFAIGVLGVTAVACGSSAAEPAPGSSESAQITDVLTMTKRSDGDFDVVCSNGTREVATPAQILANQVCGGGNPPPASPILGRVFGRSDSCSGDPVVTVRAETDCFGLSASDASWSVWSNGQCHDISDTNIRAACLSLNTHGKAIFGRSDSCGGDPIARVTPGFDCFTLPDNGSAWSVFTDGACKDISDTTPRAACLAIEPQ